MDTQKDFEPFRKQLDALCATFDRPPAKDEMVEAYWNSLRDVRFSEVQRNVARIVRNATKDTKWPKPGDLRDQAPDETSRRSASMEAAFREAEANCVRNLDAMRAQDPELWKLEVSIAKVGRCIAAEHPSTPQFAEAVELDRSYRDRRAELLRSREVRS